MTRSLKHNVGEPHPFLWPKISSFLTLQALDVMTQHLENNKQWTVTEKLDGCNVCVSSDGWIASRKQIIARVDDPTTPYDQQHYQGAPLSGVGPLHQKLVELKAHFAATFFQWQSDFQLLAYAELVLPGTASSKEDLYKYEERNLNVGSLYVFALGLVLPNTESDDAPFLFKHGFKVTEDVTHPYFLVPMNVNVSQLLKRFDIQHVVPIKTDSLHNILTNPAFNNDLLKRKKEGFVLSSNSGKGYIKWKFYKSCSAVLDKQMGDFIDRQVNNPAAQDIAFQIAHLYKTSSRFLSSVQDSAIHAKFDLYFRTNQDAIVEKMKEATFAGGFHKNMMFDTIVSNIYFAMKKDARPFLLEPKVKIQLKKKIVRQLNQVLQANHIYNYVKTNSEVGRDEVDF